MGVINKIERIDNALKKFGEDVVMSSVITLKCSSNTKGIQLGLH